MPENGIASSDAARNGLIRRASLIAVAGNAVLAVAKVSIGLAAGSLAVLGDGIDSSTDVVIALMSLAITGIMSRPADPEHPWGHSRAETMGTTILCFILFFAGSQLILTSARELLSPETERLPSLPALFVTLASILGKIALALTMRHYGKKTGSSMLLANAANMSSDVIISSGVLVGLFVSVVFRVPFADPIAAILVGAWVVKSAIGIFKDTNLELMDGTESRGPYRLVFEAVKSVKGVARPHRARMRRIANKWDIDLDIEVDGSLTVHAAHELAQRVESAIKERLPDVYDIMIHVEPVGSGADGHGGHGPEAFGLTESDLTHP
jgi:cation diffusion facilitator family transporter